MLLDEYKIAQEVLANKTIKENKDLFVVAKYLRHEMKCDELETYAMLKSLVSNSSQNYNWAESSLYLENLATRAINYELRQIEYIIVTDEELNIISKADSPKLKRLLFTILVYAKYYNAISDNNNDWCNLKISNLYKIAKVSTRNAKEKASFLNQLCEKNFIAFSKKNTNLNIKCLFIDKKNQCGLEITDLRELGYQYINIYDSTQFIKCEECGILIKKKSKHDGSTKYCNLCKLTKKNEQKYNCF